MLIFDVVNNQIKAGFGHRSSLSLTHLTPAFVQR
jgi:hypothetical protein